MEDLIYYNNFSDALVLNDFKLNIFFDSNDAIACVRGLKHFFESSRVPKNIFSSNNVLAQSLLCTGLLPQVSLLPTHQNEFLANLDPEKYYPNYEDQHFRNQLGSFLSDVLHNKDAHKHGFGSQLEHGEAVFKLASMSAPIHWRSRIFKLINEQKFIALSDYSTDSPLVKDMDLALEIYGLLDKKRPEASINNMADAMALEHFASLVKNLKNSIDRGKIRSESWPLLFISDNNVTQAVYGSQELMSNFSVNLGNGQEFILLRQPEFFTCLSLLRAANTEVDVDATTNAYLSLQEHDHDIERFKQAILKTQSKVENFPPDESPREKLKLINDQLRSYLTNDFFIRIVLPCFSKEENRSIARELNKRQSINISLLLQDVSGQKEIQEWIDHDYAQQVKNVTKAVDSFTKEYGFLYTVSPRIAKLGSIIRKFRDSTFSESDIIHQISLTRFFIPDPIQIHFKETFLKNGYLTDKESLKSYSLHLYNQFKHHREQKQVTNQDNHLYELLSIIWLTGSYPFAWELYDPEQKYTTSILMLFGSSFVRDDKSTEKNLSQEATRRQRTGLIIDKLKDRIENEGSYEIEERVFLRAALAFLNFQIVAALNDNVFSKSYNFSDHTNNTNHGQDCLKFAQEAFRLTKKYPDIDLHLRLYVGNIYVYYTVELGTSRDLYFLGDIANNFSQNVRNHPNFWHYRYEDTLARYHYRLSKEADELSDKKSLAQSARRHIEKALKMTSQNADFPVIDEIINFAEALRIYEVSLKHRNYEDKNNS